MFCNWVVFNNSSALASGDFPPSAILTAGWFFHAPLEYKPANDFNTCRFSIAKKQDYLVCKNNY